MICSMSRKGECHDNAIAESFFHTFKDELVYNESYVHGMKQSNQYLNILSCIITGNVYIHIIVFNQLLFLIFFQALVIPAQ